MHTLKICTYVTLLVQYLLCIIAFKGTETQCYLYFVFFQLKIAVKHNFMLLFEAIRQTRWKGIILLCDGLNIGAHLPCAVKKTLAGAAALSCTIWIKPKSRRALPICLAFPPIITAKGNKKEQNTTLHEMKNIATQNNPQAFVVGQMLCS